MLYICISLKDDIYVICNGEIYNFKAIYNMINIKPDTDSDCEIIIDLYIAGYSIDQICKLLDNQNENLDDLISALPKTYQSPTMGPFCKDNEKYDVIDNITLKIKNLKNKNIKIEGQEIVDILTVNGIRFTLNDGSWGLIRASSNKPSLVIVTESPTSDKIKKEIFNFIDKLLQETGKIGEYDQKI